jgi:hypothetical protein
MDEQSQIQAIIDRLAGRPGVRLPPIAALDEPWRSIYLHVQKAGDITSAERQLFNAARDLPGGTSLAEEVLDRIPAPSRVNSPTSAPARAIPTTDGR